MALLLYGRGNLMCSYVTLGELLDALQVVKSKQVTLAQKQPVGRPCLRFYRENGACYLVSRKGQLHRLKQRHQCVPVGKLTCSLFPQNVQVSFTHSLDGISLLHGVGCCQKRQEILIEEGEVVSIYSDFSTYMQRACRIKERLIIY